MSQLGRNNYGGKLTKGTTSERDTISSPSSGDLHYNTTTNQMNIYAGGTWTELALTIQPNDVALLSGSNPPGSANNNNVFYKNTNPYNLQVYDNNGWKILPLELTNEPSFSYGTTIPSQSSGNAGNVFYNTTNNSLNLRRNSEWFSILNGAINESILHNEYQYNSHNYLVITVPKDYTEIVNVQSILNSYNFGNQYETTYYYFSNAGSGGNGGQGRTDWMAYKNDSASNTDQHTPRPTNASYGHVPDYNNDLRETGALGTTISPQNVLHNGSYGDYIESFDPFGDGTLIHNTWSYTWTNFYGGGGGGGGGMANFVVGNINTEITNFTINEDGTINIVKADGPENVTVTKPDDGVDGNHGGNPTQGYPTTISYTEKWGTLGDMWYSNPSSTDLENLENKVGGGGTGSNNNNGGKNGNKCTWWKKMRFEEIVFDGYFIIDSTIYNTSKLNYEVQSGDTHIHACEAGVGETFSVDNNNTNNDLSYAFFNLKNKYNNFPNWTTYKGYLNGGNGGDGAPRHHMKDYFTINGTFTTNSSSGTIVDPSVSNFIDGGQGQTPSSNTYQFFIIIKKT